MKELLEFRVKGKSPGAAMQEVKGRRSPPFKVSDSEQHDSSRWQFRTHNSESVTIVTDSVKQTLTCSLAQTCRKCSPKVQVSV